MISFIYDMMRFLYRLQYASGIVWNSIPRAHSRPLILYFSAIYSPGLQ